MKNPDYKNKEQRQRLELGLTDLLEFYKEQVPVYQNKHQTEEKKK